MGLNICAKQALRLWVSARSLAVFLSKVAYWRRRVAWMLTEGVWTMSRHSQATSMYDAHSFSYSGHCIYLFDAAVV
jgi:hypothetical protein